MRLTKIKLAGFKSFVDPTTIGLPSSLVGIVGPNGCGKSNTIDAVRWVMGESSAKHLRGDSMEDVIFNGSTSRKPVGQASVELVFDNSDGSLGGEYARYSEISIKRLVSRDGQSQYFLNNGRCRRRDITDIFLGTGLGPRSYAIIEQGMISRLIEAKPEELRVYIEEAAGISKYKERRRETENRIRHTRENLDRLNDLREEIEKQLNHLQRQARTAERFKDLKGQERRARGELIVLRLAALDSDVQAKEGDLREQQNRLERITADLRATEAAIEKEREVLSEANEAFNQVQGRYYKLGADITRTEQSIQHNRELRFRQERELEQAERSLTEAGRQIEEDRQRLQSLADSISALTPRLQRSRAEEASAGDRLREAEQAMRDWQTRFEEFNRRAAEPSEIAQVERTRMEHLERQIQHNDQRLQQRVAEQQAISDDALRVELETLTAQASDAEQQTEREQSRLQETLATIDQAREHVRRLGDALDELRGRSQDLRGRLASLEALQQAALGKREQAITEWLQREGLGDAPRLAEKVRAAEGWERAVETVLGDYLEAVCTAGVDPVVGALESLEHGSLLLFDTSAASGAAPAEAQTLLSKVQAPWPLTGLLGGVYVAEDLNAALTLRGRLGQSESVITRDGVWVGPSWLRVARDRDEHAGVLAREQEIKQLRHELEQTNATIRDREQSLERERIRRREVEAQRELLQAEVNRAHRALADLNTQLGTRQLRLEQVQTRRARLAEEITELEDLLQRDRQDLETATMRRNDAVSRMEVLSAERDTLASERETLGNRLDEVRSSAQQCRESAHEVALKLESVRTAEDSTGESLRRSEGQLAGLQQRRDELRSSLEDGQMPLREFEAELERLLAQRVEIEKELGEARGKVQSVEADLREKDQQRAQYEAQAEDSRTALEGLRMAWQEVKVRRQTLSEQLEESGFDLESLRREMPEEADVDSWQAKVEQLDQRIQRLGPINLAAIDEFKDQSQRKEYLDRQHQDLIEALDTLEKAIGRIDRETRNRFKETFERVNARIQEMFPKLFGGGHAFLEMTGDDLLTTGVAIMARPPGKRISTIQLLSGGEKALTAVAMVFAIFELNPAPFCLLDEVDAPLDDANVGRFCNLVREMSERVQFIYITHNKTTMELAEQLIGVTMREPGVSRLVAVDVDEAAQMATG